MQVLNMCICKVLISLVQENLLEKSYFVETHQQLKDIKSRNINKKNIEN